MNKLIFSLAHQAARRSEFAGSYHAVFAQALRNLFRRLRSLETQAENWASFAAQHSRQRRATIERKAADSVRVALQLGTPKIAIPTKVRGISDYQDAAMNVTAGDALEIVRCWDGRHVVLHGGEPLGLVDQKYDGWLLQLPRGSVRGVALQQTGSPEAEDGTRRFVGVNFALTFQSGVAAPARLQSVPAARLAA
ncbi:MAG: hypothetical protein AAGI08_03915 [Bacteroidota bacterium]